MFLDSDGHKRRLDFLDSVYGMNSEDIRTTAIEIDLLPGGDRQVPVWVMHPERCMESRVHNSALANKQTDLAWRQLEASGSTWTPRTLCPERKRSSGKVDESQTPRPPSLNDLAPAT